MASEQPAMPLPPDVNRGPALMGIAWTWVCIAIIVVGLRLFTRVHKGALGADDWLMLIALPFFIAMISILTHLVDIGGFRHMAYLSPPTLLQVVFWQLPLETIGILTLIPSKCSVACLLLRVIGPTSRWRRWTLYGIIVSIVVLNVINAILVWAQCRPAKALWDPTVKGDCWDPEVLVKYSEAAASWNVVTDAALALLPMGFLWQLNAPIRYRIELTVVMGLGLIAAACAAAKTSLLGEITAKSDLTWDTFPVHCLAATENFLIIFCGSVPPLRSLWERFMIKAKTSSLALLRTSRGGSRGSSLPYSGVSSSGEKRGSDAQDTSLSSSEAGIKRVVDIEVRSSPSVRV